MRLVLLVTVVLTLGPACGGDDGSLLVDLRTDLEPGTDFTEVETRVGTRAPTVITANATATFATGQRIAEADGLEAGTYDVVVTLYTDRGSVLASRRTAVTVDGTTALLVTITRGCIGLDECTWSGPDAGVLPDAAPPDASERDASMPRDGSPGDAGRPDGGAPDAGVPDAGPPDACVAEGSEVCNGADDDCDGAIDEGMGPSRVCPCLRRAFGASTYLFCSDVDGFDEARSVCGSMGYRLVIIETPEENAWLASQLPTTTPHYIGLTDQSVEGTFRWIDGSLPTFTNWRAGEPDDSSGQDCASIERDAFWDDRGCINDYDLVCEAD